MGRYPDSSSLELKGARNSRTWVGERKHRHLSWMVAESLDGFNKLSI